MVIRCIMLMKNISSMELQPDNVGVNIVNALSPRMP